MEITVSLDSADIFRVVDKLNAYEHRLREKANKICERLSFIGAWEATTGFSQAIYDGDKDFDVRVDPVENGFEIIADGETVLFLEFGAGITYGYGHPQATEFGMGPGTWPYPHGMPVHGKWMWNWENPNGWYFTDGAGEKHHTYGNAPAMPMYNTAKDLRSKVEEVAREVFLND